MDLPTGQHLSSQAEGLGRQTAADRFIGGGHKLRGHGRKNGGNGVGNAGFGNNGSDAARM